MRKYPKNGDAKNVIFAYESESVDELSQHSGGDGIDYLKIPKTKKSAFDPNLMGFVVGGVSLFVTVLSGIFWMGQRSSQYADTSVVKKMLHEHAANPHPSTRKVIRDETSRLVKKTTFLRSVGKIHADVLVLKVKTRANEKTLQKNTEILEQNKRRLEDIHRLIISIKPMRRRLRRR